MTQDENKTAMAFTSSTFDQLVQEEIKKMQLYEMRNSTLKKVRAGQISLPCYNLVMTKQNFPNTAAAELEECLHVGKYCNKPMRWCNII
jgi:hypothetical protein